MLHKHKYDTKLYSKHRLKKVTRPKHLVFNIEKLRMELNDLINNSEYICLSSDPEILRKGKQLDLLLNEYYSNDGNR